MLTTSLARLVKNAYMSATTTHAVPLDVTAVDNLKHKVAEPAPSAL